MNSRTRPSLMYRGRPIGIVAVVVAQLLVGFLHLVFGVWMLTAQITPFGGIIASMDGPDVYSIYTVTFSLLTLIFAVPLWMQRRWGWVGTVAVALFVIVADSLTLLDLPSVPGIPKFAGFGEISYSVVIVLYLLQPHIRDMYRIHLAERRKPNSSASNSIKNSLLSSCESI